MKKYLIVVLGFIFYGCQLSIIHGEDVNFKYKIIVENTSNSDVILYGFFRKKLLDSIVLKSKTTFERKILYDRGNHGIWSDEANGGRDSITIVFERKRIIEVPPSYTNPSGKFNWLMEYHAGIKPQRGFRTFNPVTKAYNSGTFHYEITEEDYKAATPL